MENKSEISVQAGHLGVWTALLPNLFLYCMALLAVLPLFENGPTFPKFLFIWISLFSIYLFTLKMAGNVPKGSIRIGTVLMAATVLRLPLLFQVPLLSDDIYRYIWDGHVLFHGINPFKYAPDAMELAHLVAPLHSLINFPEIPTVYPPLAQLLFFVGYLIGPTTTASKLIWVAFDIGNVLLIALLLRHFERPVYFALIYAMAPLAVLETSWSGHLDTAGVFFMLLAFLLYEKQRWIPGHLAVAASILVKFVPIVLLPMIFFRVKKRQWMVLIPLVFVAAYIPFYSAGSNLWFAFFNYSRKWYFNASGFWLISKILDDPMTARLFAGGLFLTVIGFFTFNRRFGIIECSLGILAVWLLLTTTVHPWYFLWILPFLCFFPFKSLLFWSWSIGLSYFAVFARIETGTWHESNLILAVEYLGLLIIAAVEIYFFAAHQRAIRKESKGSTP